MRLKLALPQKLLLLTLLLAVVSIAVFFAGCAPEAAVETPQVVISADETDPFVFGQNHPLIFASFRRTQEMIPQPFGGSIPYDYLEVYPYLVTLYDGFGFAREFRQSRGHFFALADQRGTARPKPGATCMACKSSDYPRLREKYGEDFYAMCFQNMAIESTHGISCSDCHDPETMDLRITRPFLLEALEGLGRDITNISQEEMGMLVCLQCHVEYYFEPGTLAVALPWSKGLEVEDQLDHYDDRGFSEWVHPVAGSEMIKVQHPEYELYVGSIHYNQGLSCADCHMPSKVDEATGEEFVSHWWTSPFNHIQESCLDCHANTTEEELFDRTVALQTEVHAKQNAVGEHLKVLIITLGERIAENFDADKIAEAQRLHRRAQTMWDFVKCDNSTGFHNYAKSMQILGDADDYTTEALEILEQ